MILPPPLAPPLAGGDKSVIMTNQSKAIVIVGPTSSGKTELSLRLVKKFNGVVISADSRQIYRHMDIATAKTTKAQQQGITHYMIDIADPDEEFTLAIYQHTVNNLLKAITEDNEKRKAPIVPFIVGGTGLYIKAVVNGYQLPTIPPNKILREELNQKTLATLIKQLLILDPTTRVDLKNKRRVIRALEILMTQPNLAPKIVPPAYDFLKIGISRPRAELYQRIDNKVEEMYRAGLVKETQKLLGMGHDFTSPSMSAHGYKHIQKYLEHKITLKAALESMKKDTRHYVKRQMTWFKKDPQIHWIQSPIEAEKLIAAFLS